MRALPRLAPLLALLALVPGCGGTPGLRYRVALDPADRPDVTVTVEVSGARRDSLVLEGLAPAALMPISRVEARGPNGLLRSSLSVRAVGAGAAARDYDFVRIEGPVPPRVTVTYRVALGAREGDAHTGFTGRRAGAFEPGYAFAGGRSLFLVPRGARSGRPIDVAF